MYSRRIRSLTLIELVVVLAILVILAGLILPKLDVFQLKANKGVAASNMTDVSRFVQQFRILNNEYPDGWDSLVDSNTDALWIATASTPGLDPQLVGGPVLGSPTKLTTTTIVDTDELRSLTRVGITTVLDVNTTTPVTAAAGEAFVTPRLLDVGERIATINAADGDGAAIIAHIYPQTGVLPSGKKLAVFGLGPKNEMNGEFFQEVPFYSNTTTQYYNRYLAVFEYSTGGSRAELKAILGADADRIDEEIKDFYER